MSETVIIVGLGEVGKPLMEIIKPRHQTHGVDIGIPAPVTTCDVMHVCFPFHDDKFAGQVVTYIRQYNPLLTVINSTVSPGTTRRIAELSGTAVVNSPVRGKHIRMQQEMLHYDKFIGAINPEAGKRAVDHFQSVGIKTRLLTSPEASELAKLTETTYFGLLIAWAQEVERYCTQVGASYEEVIGFYEEIKFLPPVKYFPGVIGGHCVMPNIAILKQHFSSEMLDAIVHSNELKQNGGRKPED